MSDISCPHWLGAWRDMRAKIQSEGRGRWFDDPNEEECEWIVLELLDHYGTAKCARCKTPLGSLTSANKRGLYQCPNRDCKHQMSAVSLTFMRGTRVPIHLWFSIANAMLEREMTTGQLAKQFGRKHDTVARMEKRIASVLSRPDAFCGRKRLGATGHSKVWSIRQKRIEARYFFNTLTSAQKQFLGNWIVEPDAEMQHALRAVVRKWAHAQRTR